MASKIGPEQFDITLKFGGGLHTRAAEDDIGEREAADGQNFLLDLENRELRRRPPFDLVATAPNAGSINGGGSLLKEDGTVVAFFQAGATVYEFDGESFDASPVLDTVSASAKLRGHWRSHVWHGGTTDKLLVTDLALQEPVMEWDGSTWQDVGFLSDPSTAFGAFKAKYCQITNERAIFAHCVDPGATTRHIIVGSMRGDYQTLTVDNRPSSALSDEDPFFLLAPDLRPINGLVEAFGTLLISTEQGQLYNLTGSSAQDFAIEDFYPGSGAAGAESLAYIGNDVIYGRKGRVESVSDTDRFGDSEANDLTREVLDVIKAYTGWTTVYNSRLNRVYLFPTGQSEVWVFDTAMRGGEVSPWMRWRTTHSLAFQPTFVASMLDPSDGLEYVFMGDSSGRVFRLEGTGAGGDGGTDAVDMQFTSRLFSAPLTASAYRISGYVRYRKNVAATIELTFMFAGTNIFTHSLTISLPAVEGRRYYAADKYYNAGEHYGTVSGRLARQPFAIPGQAEDFQVRVRVNGTPEFSINEIGLRLTAAG